MESFDTDPALERQAQGRRFSAALDRFTDGVHQSLDEAWAWAEEADKVLAEAASEISDLRRQVADLEARAEQLEEDRAKARAAVSGLSEAVRTYVKATSEGQRSLLELTRRFISGSVSPTGQSTGAPASAGPATPHASGVLRTDERPVQQPTETAHPEHNGGTVGDPAMSWSLPLAHRVDVSDGGDFQFEPEFSDERRLIDLKNRLDMNRLDMMSRLAPSRTLSRRRTS